MWLMFSCQFYLEIDLGVYFGVYPRHWVGLIGVLLAPLIHGDINHLLSNTLPFLLLGVILFYFYSRIARPVFCVSYFLPSLLVWIFGRDFYHIGASGVIYSLAFFLMLFGLFRKDTKSLTISILVVLLYGGLFYGLHSNDPRVSWESHAFGAGVGTVLAFVYRNKRKVD
ncbi:rhombosortase [Reichenbachiella sp. 5M10]|nr:rhombosortase [Reichenbachiella sp. 5M10]